MITCGRHHFPGTDDFNLLLRKSQGLSFVLQIGWLQAEGVESLQVGGTASARCAEGVSKYAFVTNISFHTSLISEVAGLTGFHVESRHEVHVCWQRSEWDIQILLLKTSQNAVLHCHVVCI